MELQLIEMLNGPQKWIALSVLLALLGGKPIADLVRGFFSLSDRWTGGLKEQMDLLEKDIHFLEGKDPIQQQRLTQERKSLSLLRRHGIKVPALLVDRIEALSENNPKGISWREIKILSRYLKDDGHNWLKVEIAKDDWIEGWITIFASLPYHVMGAVSIFYFLKTTMELKYIGLLLFGILFFFLGMITMRSFGGIMIARKMKPFIEKK